MSSLLNIIFKPIFIPLENFRIEPKNIYVAENTIRSSEKCEWMKIYQNVINSRKNFKSKNNERRFWNLNEKKKCLKNKLIAKLFFSTKCYAIYLENHRISFCKFPNHSLIHSFARSMQTKYKYFYCVYSLASTSNNIVKNESTNIFLNHFKWILSIGQEHFPLLYSPLHSKLCCELLCCNLGISLQWEGCWNDVWNKTTRNRRGKNHLQQK